MSQDDYQAEEERRRAEERIERIRSGGAGPSGQPVQPYDDGLAEEVDSSTLLKARSRAELLRGELGSGSAGGRAPVARARRAPSRTLQAFAVIGGMILVGIVIVALIALLASISGGGGISIPFLNTATPTATPTPVFTPTPLATETPTPTRPAPNLALPPLTCIFQSGQGCYDYCQNPANSAECQSAKDFVRAQGADPDFWLSCIAPATGPNVGNPQKCLEDAWRKLNP
jgi:hypothetical protein